MPSLAKLTISDTVGSLQAGSVSVPPLQRVPPRILNRSLSLEITIRRKRNRPKYLLAALSTQIKTINRLEAQYLSNLLFLNLHPNCTEVNLTSVSLLMLKIKRKSLKLRKRSISKNSLALVLNKSSRRSG